MRPQTIAVTAASIVTGLFLAAVGIVLTMQWHDTLPAAPNGAARIAQNPVQRQRGNFVGGPRVFQQDAIEFNLQAPPLAEPIVELPFTPQELPKARGALVPAKEYALSGPHQHGNLAIFLIHGPDTLKDAKVLTLQEAIEQNVAVVHDRGNLLIENRGKTPLFIQSGDIVKGGNQDRTLPFDLLISAQSTIGPVAAMCVEQNRSFPRGNELSTSFAIATEQLPGKTLRMAAYRQSQADVWNSVRSLQTNLARNVGGSVQSPQSHSSLQLSLESPRLQQAIQECLTELTPATENQGDAIGIVVAVNGKIHSADVYASANLFQRVWPKLLRSSAVEALAERQPGAATALPSADAVQAFLADAEQAPAFRRLANRTTMIRQESARTLLYDTCDPSQENVVLHRSFLAK